MQKSQVKKTEVKPKTLNPLAIYETVLYAKQDFIRKSGIKKWPQLDISVEAPLGIRTAYRMNIDPRSNPINTYHAPVQLEDYGFIEITEEFYLDKLNNYVEYMKDKAI